MQLHPHPSNSPLPCDYSLHPPPPPPSLLLPWSGGPAAILAQNCIKKVEVLEYPELGMEAVWRIEVEDFPAFIVVDDKGNDFFQKWQV